MDRELKAPEEYDGLKHYLSGRIDTTGFQDVIFGINKLIKVFPLYEKFRVILKYDPEARNVKITTITYTQDDH